MANFHRRTNAFCLMQAIQQGKFPGFDRGPALYRLEQSRGKVGTMADAT